MTAIVKPADTALDTRLVNIACADQKPDSAVSGQSLSATAGTAATDKAARITATGERGRRRSGRVSVDSELHACHHRDSDDNTAWPPIGR